MFKGIFKQPEKDQPSPSPANSTPPKPKTKTRNSEPGEADLATLELLQATETYPILVLMLPRLVVELKARLTEIDQELGTNTAKLQQLYNRRNDILATSAPTNDPTLNQMGKSPTTSNTINPATKEKQGVAA